MANSNGIISSPATMATDIAAVIGIAGTNLEESCKSSAINIWSPRKPIYSTKLVLDSDDFKGGAHSVSGYKTGGGILKPVASGSEYVGSIGSNGEVPNAVWTHDRPVSDGSCKFRLSDFIGYWHNVGRMFTIGTIYGNIDNIPLPSSDADVGTTLGFSMWFSVSSGQITAQELFGDCKDGYGNYFYPGVIMSSGGDDKLHYVKTADQPISAYFSGSTASFTVNTRLFMNKMKSEWLNRHSGDPYANFPFRTGDKWTACIILISRRFDGGSGDYDSSYKLNGSESIVRLEYSSPSGDSHVDRRTLPVKQSKYSNIEWIKFKITIRRQGTQGGYEVYNVASIVVTAKMLTTDTVSFTVDAQLSVPQGYVNVVSTASGQSISVTGYSNVSFSGQTGEVSKTLSITGTTYNVYQGASTGNKLCNGTLTFRNSGDSFSGGFSIDISSQSWQYEREVTLQ